MFDPKTIYQTISTRNDIATTEKNGPIECKDIHNEDWLGSGYYFWDSHIELAHKWGDSRYKINRKEYYICKSTCKLNIKCYDLHESGAKRIEFESYARKVEQNLKKSLENILVRDIFVFLRSRHEWISKYDSIRILGNGSFQDLMKKRSIRYFNHNNNNATYLKHPAVQFCFFKLDVQSLTGYKIIHKSANFSQEWA